MNEDQFLKTMIETIKYKKNKNKDQLLTILRNSEIDFEKTRTFSDKPQHFREYIDLRVPIPMLEEAESLKEDLEILTSIVYRSSGNYEYWGLNIKPKPVELDNNLQKVEHDVVFDEIKDKIIQGIRGAKYSIWVAVAWFTDREIFNELLLRKREGVHVRIIISNEEGNKYLLSDLESNFEVVKVQLKQGERFTNRLHDKFCIIDLEYVMHGSYNWSNNAKNNNETWATALDRDFVRKFADEFIKLFISN